MSIKGRSESSLFQLLIFCFCLICFSETYSQSVGFRTRHYPQGLISNATQDIVGTHAGKYMGIGIGVDTSGNSYCNRMVLVGLNNIGQVTWEKRYGNLNFQYLYNSTITRIFFKHQGHLYISTSVLDSSNSYIGVLLKINFDGDIVWKKMYKDSIGSIIPQRVTTSVDGGFLITGYGVDSSGTSAPCLLIKTDSSGNEIWRKFFHKTGVDVSSGKAIIQDSTTKKIVIVGYQLLGSTTDYTGHDLVLILDSIGNVQMRKSYYTGNRSGVSDLVQTKDKNIVMVGAACKGLDNWQNEIYCPLFLKFGLDFIQSSQPIWYTVNFDTPDRLNSFFNIKELPNGNLITSGSFELLTESSSNYIQRIATFNSSGSLLRRQIYDYKPYPSSSTNQQFILTLNLTGDGGWVSAIYEQNPGVDPFFWVKYDSTGCDGLLVVCANPLGTEEPTLAPQLNLGLYPNPAQNEITLYSENASPAEIVIYDLSGRELRQMQNISSGQKIDISNLPLGCYFILLNQEGRSLWQKVLKN